MSKAERIKVFENAVVLLESAKCVAERGHYGLACSLIVLSLEEFIKYQVVLTNSGEGVVFDAGEVRKVFSQHKTKHALLAEFQESLSARSIVAFEEWVIRTVSGQDPVQDGPGVQKFMSTGSFLATAFQEIALTESDRIDFILWLAEADEIKKKGLYVNLATGQRSFPTDLSSDDYQRALKFAVAVRNQTEVLKDMDLTEEEFVAWLNTPTT